jgi:hypothetical protein
VPFGENLVIRMIGKVTGSEYAVGRTCKFAIRPDEDPPSPHLYFARTVSWAASETPANAIRLGGEAITHRDGSALFVGGLDGTNAAVPDIDRFDAFNGAFEEVAGVEARVEGAVAALGDGRIVIAGGHDPMTDQVVMNLEVLVVDQHRVEPVAAGPLAAKSAPALATLSDGRIVAFGGEAGMPLDQIVEINGDGAGITLRVLQRAKLATARFGHTATRLSDDLGAPVLIAGGRNASGDIATAELYKPLVEQMAAGFAPPMQVPRHDHSAVRLPDGSVLIVGGFDAAGPVTALEIFTLEGGFQLVGSLPSNAGVTGQTLTPLPDGRILLAGGKDVNGAVVSSAFIIGLDPIGGSIDVVTTDPLAVPRADHQATSLCDGTVMLVGGTGTATAAERYNPASTGR